jgi:hypothetical protein
MKIMRHKAVLLLIITVLALATVGLTQASAAQYCYQPARLLTGTQGRVTLYPNQPNRLRNDPSYYGTVLSYIPVGASFDIISGPVCSSYTNWWQVRYNGQVGWTAEGDGGSVYWLEPVVYTPPPPTCAPATRLSVGSYGRVTPGLPNTVRSGAGVYGTVRIGQIPAGGTFVVLSGPNCGADGRWWWYVNHNGLIGWTAEGQGSTYWLEPSNGNPGPLPPCALPTRLSVYGWGQVTPGSPNVLRSAPGTQATGSNSVVIGSIPGGAVFSVQGGPSCGTDGRWWWYVSYNGQLGWTAEGEGTTYWVQPYYGL